MASDLSEFVTSIVLVSVDCLRNDRVYDNHRYTTPNLHRLRSESIVFENAYSTGPYTTESIPGLIAGQHSHNGCYFGSDVTWKAIRSPPTLASWLGELGYETVAMLTNPHLSRERNFDIGFDQFTNLRLNKGTESPKGVSYLEKVRWGELMYQVRSKMRDHDSLLTPYSLPMIAYRYMQTLGNWPTISGHEVVEELCKSIPTDQTDFFAWTHLMDLHAPIRPSTVRSGGLSAVNGTLGQIITDASRAARIHKPEYDTMYDSALRYVDHQIGEIIRYLKKEDRWNDTILIITGDHGEVLFDRDEIYGHPPHHLYDDLLHVPLIVRTPNNNNSRIETPVSLAWIHELIAEICNLPLGSFPGSSDQESLLDDDGLSSPVVSDTLDKRGHTIAIRDDDEKVIHHSESAESASINYPYQDKDVQFSYQDDPRERLPIDPVTSSELQERVEELETSPGDLPKVDGRFGRDLESQLADLGYKM
ncbi:sulfatase [Halogeometricum luteum]|uniref:Sulfatase n=1 Tax=Halogeometricum luteum TaxID=2950537 RepID=A0ABU2G3H6_9EURY|nr:sulfatase [Halogeometricum sp. S3BR5-2]MDS0295346.1 sulfatase [Halogeometricum sp. S3BR5-2]